MYLGYNREQDSLLISRSLQALSVERDERVGYCDRTWAGARGLQRGHLTLAWVFRVKNCFSWGKVVQIISKKRGGGINKKYREREKESGEDEGGEVQEEDTDGQGSRMQERAVGSKGQGSREADSSKQRSGCFLGEDQTTDSGSAASSSSQGAGSRME